MKIQIAVLTQGEIRSELSKSLIQIVTNNLGYDLSLVHSQHIMVDNNRNIIVKKFLESDCDYLLMIDDDNPPNRNPLELVELNKDVIILPTPMFKKTGIVFNVFKQDNNKYETLKYNGKDKLVQIDNGGTGCVLIKRSVLEKIERPFESEWLDDGTRGMGSDIKFCNKVKESGFEVWTHWDYICSHYKCVDLLDILEIIR